MFNTKSETTYKDSTYEFSRKKSTFPVILSFFLFILFNTLKITIFNMCIVPANTIEAFLYKYAVTFLVVSAGMIFIFSIKSRLLFAGIYLLQTLYIFAGLAYFMYFRSYLHLPQSIALLTEGTKAAAKFSIPKSPLLLTTVIDLPVFAYMQSKYMKILEFNNHLGIHKHMFIALFLLLAGLTEGFNYMHGYSFVHLIKDYAQNEHIIVERYGTFLNSLAGLKMNSSEHDLINSFNYGRLLYSDGSNRDKPNIAVIQVEAMDSNVINMQYKGKYIAPFLQSLSKKNMYYPYVLSYHKAGGTSDCEFSIINSIEPLDDYPSMKLTTYTYPNSMVKRLVSQGYSAIAFHGNVASYFSRNYAYPRMGFQAFDDMNVMGLKDIGWGAPDKAVFSHAKNRMKELSQPFFAYTITMTSHGPYTNARYYYDNNHYDDIKDEVVRDYFNSMSYVDESLREYIAFIRNNFKNTYIFIFGDHTPNISNKLYSQASFIEDNKYFEFVPLIIITPDNRVYRENSQVASFLDISPTILEAAGVSYKVKSDGINLLQEGTHGGKIPFKGKKYDRNELYNKIASKK